MMYVCKIGYKVFVCMPSPLHLQLLKLLLLLLLSGELNGFFARQ